jgi:hypothetical protein
MTYKLIVKETANKAGRYHYQVIDETGKVISERKSNRKYVACTIGGGFYFGRIDLIGKGDHGKYLKYCAGWGRDKKGDLVPGMYPDKVTEPTPIAYLDHSFYEGTS